MGNSSVPKFIFRLSRFPVYRGSVLGRFYCISFSLSTPLRRIWGEEVRLHSFLTSSLHGGEWFTSRPSRSTAAKSGTHGIRDSVGSRGDLEVLEKKDIYCPSGIRSPDPVLSLYWHSNLVWWQNEETRVTCSHRSLVHLKVSLRPTNHDDGHLWVAASRTSMAAYRRFGETCCLHFQSILTSESADSSDVKMIKQLTSDTSYFIVCEATCFGRYVTIIKPSYELNQ